MKQSHGRVVRVTSTKKLDGWESGRARPPSPESWSHDDRIIAAANDDYSGFTDDILFDLEKRSSMFA